MSVRQKLEARGDCMLILIKENGWMDLPVVVSFPSPLHRTTTEVQRRGGLFFEGTVFLLFRVRSRFFFSGGLLFRVYSSNQYMMTRIII